MFALAASAAMGILPMLHWPLHLAEWPQLACFAALRVNNLVHALLKSLINSTGRRNDEAGARVQLLPDLTGMKLLQTIAECHKSSLDGGSSHQPTHQLPAVEQPCFDNRL